MIQNLLKQVRDGLSRFPRGRLSKFSLPISGKIGDKVAASSNSNGNHESNPKVNGDLKVNNDSKTNNTQEASESKLRKLLVFNSFTKSKQPASANSEPIYLTNNNNTTNRLARAYICGPTVYDESHIGHAMTYLRFDLIRRALKRYGSVDLGR